MRFTLNNMVTEAQRELGQRRKVYPREAMKHPADRSKFDYHYQCMVAIRHALEVLHHRRQEVPADVIRAIEAFDVTERF